MRGAYSVYRLSFEVKGPVFVGNGKDISKKEYLFLPGKKLAVIDIEKFYALMKQRGLAESFERFMMRENRENLRSWMERNEIRKEEIQHTFRYVLPNNQESLERGRPLQILQFVKDPYGNPYIPGSSIKGMLRTILLAEDIINNPDQYQTAAREITGELKKPQDRQGRYGNRYILNGNLREIESRRFHQLNYAKNPLDAVNDMMSGFIVGDSEPLEMESIILCQKIDVHVDGREKKFNLLRECLKPGTEITCMLTVDNSRCKISSEQIQDAVSTFASQYYENFGRHFPHASRPGAEDVFLGGGCGFVSKTIVYPLFPELKGVKVTKDIFDKIGVPSIHKHRFDTEYGVSPHTLKCTRMGNEIYAMGLCSMDIRPWSDKT